MLLISRLLIFERDFIGFMNKESKIKKWGNEYRFVNLEADENTVVAVVNTDYENKKDNKGPRVEIVCGVVARTFAEAVTQVDQLLRKDCSSSRKRYDGLNKQFAQDVKLHVEYLKEWPTSVWAVEVPGSSDQA